MEEKILIVEDTFLIKERGLVIAGLLETNTAIFKIGDKIKIKRPDNLIVFTEVAGIEITTFKYFSEIDRTRKTAFLVRNINKESIPKDSIVFLMK